MTLLEAAKQMLECVGDGFFIRPPDDSIASCPECDECGFDVAGKDTGHKADCEFGNAIASLRKAVESE